MSDAMIKYAQQLRQLVNEYYHQQLTFDDYRAQRKIIFDHIEKELAGGNNGSELRQAALHDESTTSS